MEQYEKTIKDNIRSLINAGKIPEASVLISRYQSIVQNDVEVYSMQAVVAILEGRLSDATSILHEALNFDKNNFDLLYNLAYVYEAQEKNQKAYELYLNLIRSDNSVEYHDLIVEAIQRLQKFEVNGHKDDDTKKKMVFFIKQGMDSFLGDIIKGLSVEFEIKKVIVTNTNQINEGMRWADVCWFEWCDDLVVYGSKLDISKKKKIFCRIHGYEVYGEGITETNWENIDNLIVVAPHILRIFQEKVEKNRLTHTKINLVYCGVSLDQFNFRKRKKGFNIGYLGYVNFKKNIPLTLDIFYQLYLTDKRYKLYLAGAFQDERTLRYFQYFVQDHNLANNIFFDGWKDQSQKIEWLEKIDYMLISSIDEGLCYAAAESMASGIKPILHNCEGLKDHYPSKYLFSTQDEAIKMIIEESYNSIEYREYIEKTFSLSHELKKIIKLIRGCSTNDENNCKKESIVNSGVQPLVTIGIINYNQEKFIEDCIESVLKQDYPNKEILVIDDCSTDKSMEIIEKYCLVHPNIRIIKHEVNSGSGSKGVQDVVTLAKGKYFTFIDADDYYPDQDIITNYVCEIDKDKDLDFVYGNFRIVDIEGKSIDVWKYKDFNRFQVISDVFHRFGSGVLPMIGLYKKDFYNKNNLTWYYDKNLKVGYDTINSLINLKNNWQFKYLDKDCLCYRRHSDNITNNFQERIHCVLKIADYIIDNFDEKIYLAHVKWNELRSKKLKKSVKLFSLGVYFYEVFKQFSGINPSSPWKFEGSSCELLGILKPLEEKSKLFLKRAIKLNKELSLDINRIQEEIEKIKEKISKRASIEIQNIKIPKVSVIIPTFNRKEMLKEALESVLAQDYPNLEVIVSDNASADGTYEMMQDYRHDNRVIYHRNKQNLGMFENSRYPFLHIASGEYNTVLCDDDKYIDNTFLSKAAKFLSENPNVSFVHANCMIKNDSTGQVTFTSHEAKEITNGIEYFLNYEKPSYDHVTSSHTGLFRRENFIQMGGYGNSESYAGDLLMWSKLMLTGDVGCLKDCVAYYRIHANQVSNMMDPDSDYNTIEELEFIKEKAKEKGISRVLIDNWIQDRIYKYVRWSVQQYLINKREKIAFNLLWRIREKYPVAYQNVCQSLGIKLTN